jgi:hypothetical protein
MTHRIAPFLLLLLAAPQPARAAAPPVVVPADTIGWWLGPTRVPNAYLGSDLSASIDIPMLQARFLPDGKGGFIHDPHDSLRFSVGNARYDLGDGTFAASLWSLSPLVSCGMRVSAADVFELRGATSQEAEVEIVVVVDAFRERSPITKWEEARLSARLSAASLVVSGRSWSEGPVALCDHPFERKSLSPSIRDTLSIPWRARPGDQVEIRVVLEVSDSKPQVGRGQLRLYATLSFEGLPPGTQVSPARFPPPRPIETGPMIKSIYR